MITRLLATVTSAGKLKLVTTALQRRACSIQAFPEATAAVSAVKHQAVHNHLRDFASEIRKYKCAGQPIPPAVHQAALEIAAQVGDIAIARASLKSIITQGMVPDVLCWKLAAMAGARAGDAKYAFSILKQMRSYGISPNAEVFDELNRIFAAQKMEQHVKSTIEQMKEANIQESLVTLTAKLRVSKDFMAASNIWEQMQSYRKQFTSTQYLEMIRIAALHDKLHKALYLYRTLRRTRLPIDDISAAHSTMRAVFNAVNRVQYDKQTRVYTHIYEMTHSMFIYMHWKGVPLASKVAACFAHSIHVLIPMSRAAVYTLWNVVQRQIYSIPPHLCAALVRCTREFGTVEELDAMLERLLREEYIPDEHVMLAFMRAYVSSQSPERIMTLFELCREYHIPVTREMYSLVCVIYRLSITSHMILGFTIMSWW